MSQYERIAKFEAVLKLRDLRRRKVRNFLLLLMIVLCASIVGCL